MFDGFAWMSDNYNLYDVFTTILQGFAMVFDRYLMRFMSHKMIGDQVPGYGGGGGYAHFFSGHEARPL